MAEYWPKRLYQANAAEPTISTTTANDDDDEDDFDRQRRRHLGQDSANGWKEELERYLQHSGVGIAKDMDTVVWWGVSYLL